MESVKPPKRKGRLNVSEPAYLDIDQQQWTGRQIFLADIRTDAAFITPRFVQQVEFHASGDATSQHYLSPTSYPGAATQVTSYLPAAGGTLAAVGNANTWALQQAFQGGAVVTIPATLDFIGDYGSGDPAFATLTDNNAGGVVSLKGPGVGYGVARTQRFQDGDGFLALQGSAGGLAVQVGNSTDPPASGAMGKVNRTAQSAAVASTKLTNATSAGYYLVHYTLEDTTSDITAGTIQFQINYTDDIGATTQTGATLALTATGRDRGSFNVYLASGDISYQTNLVGIIGTARYALRVRCTYLG